MKKILLLLCALLGTVGAWAAVTQPTLTTDANNPTYYVIQNFRSGKYANYAGASAQLLQVTSADAGATSLWYFMANGDGVSIVPATDPSLKLASHSSATAEGAVWYLPENPYKSGVFCVSLTSGATANCWDDQGGHTTIGYWQPAANDNEGTSWNIVEIPVTKAEVDAGTVDLSWALTKSDVLARLAPLSSLSVYTAANITAVRNAANESELNAALKAFETNITLFCRSNKYLVVGESACSYVASPEGYEEVIQLESAGIGTFYLKGYKSGKYISEVRQSTAVNTTETPNIRFYFQNYNGYTVVRDYTGNDYAYIHNGGSGCVGWVSSADNTQHTIQEVELPAEIVNVTYHLMVGGVDKAQASVECGVGDAPAVPSSLQYAYTTYSYDVATIASTTSDVYVTAEFNLPFTTSSDFENATWYYATLRGKYLRADDTAKDDSGRYQTNASNGRTDAYKWAFFGNPVDGIYVMNKNQGSGKYLYQDVQFNFTSLTDPTADNHALFAVTPNSNGGFTLRSISGGATYYVNDAGSGGNLGFWNSGSGANDGGSNWIVEVVPEGEIAVKYTIIVDENTIATDVLAIQLAGNSPEVPSDYQYGFVDYTYSIETLTNNTTTVTATGTSSLPFEVSRDFATATWYYLHGHGNRQSDYISTDGTATVWANGKSNTDAYKWAFIGNPVTGIQIINKASGDGYYLTNTDPATMTTTAMSWTIKKQTNTSFYSFENGFGLYDNSRSQYINAQASTLKYWGAFDAGSTFWVEEIPAVLVKVTFNLIEGDETVNTIEVADVAGNTTINVPSALTANYSTLCYTFTGNEDVNVGETDLTVNVIATLKAGVVTDLANLSNNKAYKLTTERGDLYIKNDHLASNHNDNAGADAGTFALIKYEDSYYLYSVDASKFVLGDGSLSTTVTSDVAALNITAQDLKHLYLMVLGEKGLNVTNTNDDYELVINNYVTPDPGNRYAILEVADFNSEAAVAALDEYFNNTNFYDRVETEVVPFLMDSNGNPSPTIGKPFGLSIDAATTIVETYMTQLNNQNFSSADYEGIIAAKNAGIIYPEKGKFYLIKNNYNGKYMRVSADGARGTVLADLTAEEAAKDASAIVCFTADDNDSKLYMRSQGKYFNWVYNYEGYEAYIVDAKDKYVHFAVPAPGVGAFSIALGNGEGNYASELNPGFYALGDESTMVVRGSSNGAEDAKAQWTFEEVSSLTITLDNPINDNYYATLCVPFDVTVEGATAYTITKGTGNVLTTTEVEGTIAAGTPVLLIGSSNSATATIAEDAAYSSAISTETALTGSYLEVAGLDGAINYVLGKDESKAGFFHTEGTTLKANSAYLAGDESTSAIEAFYFDLDSTDLVGDVNGDGSITIADVTALVNIILGKDDVEPYQYNHAAADVNKDEHVTIADVTALVNIILGKNN